MDAASRLPIDGERILLVVCDIFLRKESENCAKTAIYPFKVIP